MDERPLVPPGLPDDDDWRFGQVEQVSPRTVSWSVRGQCREMTCWCMTCPWRYGSQVAGEQGFLYLMPKLQSRKL